MPPSTRIDRIDSSLEASIFAFTREPVVTSALYVEDEPAACLPILISVYITVPKYLATFWQKALVPIKG